MIGSPVRAFARVFAYSVLTLVLVPVQLAALALGVRAAERVPLLFHRLSCWILGLNVTVRGAPPRERPTLFVGNHASYLDIVVLGSLVPASFVAKAEIAGWPVFGPLARLQRSLFIDRRALRVTDHRDQIGARLKAGDNLVLFPEGTSSDGNRVLPFKSALFAAAEVEVSGRPVLVQPVTINYTRLDGIPLGWWFRPYVAWYGGMGLVPHAWRLLGLGFVACVVTFHAPVRLDDFANRKALADHCRRVIAETLCAVNSDRAPPAPEARPDLAAGA